MAPPGVNTFYDQVDMMTISGLRSPALLKSPFSSTSSSLSPPFSKQPRWSVTLPSSPSSSSSSSSNSASLSSVHADHDYVMKPVLDTPDNSSVGMTIADDRGLFSSDENNNDKASNESDTMLSSCAIDNDKSSTDDICDTDFLQDLDDLDFNFDDLDPCGDVGMEDSFQDFIDSALDKPYTSYLDAEAENVQGQDAVILSEEDFMGVLGLKPVVRNQGSDQSPQSPALSPLSFSNASFPALSSPTSTESPSTESVPTKLCLCSGFDNSCRVLYSVAHSTDQEDVRVCSSTQNALQKAETDNTRVNGSPVDVHTDVTSPLYVDTSFQPLTDECLDILMNEDLTAGDHNEAAEFFSWLSDNQNQQQSHNMGSGSKSNVDGIPGCQDLESFVDLEDFVMDTDSDTDGVIKSSAPSHDHTYQKTENLSDFDKNESFGSQLKLSFLSDLFEHMRHNDSVRDHSSVKNQCVPSPGSLVSDHNDELSTAMLSPLPTVDDISSKNHLALLNLFSDENAASLLHTDSVVPNIRFM